jgi:hypothetical protein
MSCAGRIKWVRSLHSHLDDLVKEASSHPVLKTLPATSELLRHYNIVGTALVNYEADMKEMWMKQNVSLPCWCHKEFQFYITVAIHESLLVSRAMHQLTKKLTNQSTNKILNYVCTRILFYCPFFFFFFFRVLL